ncbi:MAG: ABC transporter permease [Bacteroidota bacterium]
MFELLKIELYKIFKKPRTYIGFIAITVVVVLMQMGLYSDGDSWIKLVLQSVMENMEIHDGKLLNGYLVCFLILNTLLIQVPMMVTLVTGDLISGEANMGTLRLLLTKPISRNKLLLTKMMAGLMYTLLLLIWMAFLSLFVSMFIFGTDDMVYQKSSELVVHLYKDNQGDDIFWRYMCAFVYAFISLATIAALSFMLSVFAENSIGPILSTIAIIIVFTIISNMNIPFFEKIKNYMFTTHMVGWKGFFNMKSNADNEPLRGTIYNLPAILRSGGILMAHFILFTGISMYAFRRKDILS